MSSADPEQFIDGRSIRWGLLLSTLIGSYWVTTWTGLVSTLGELYDSALRILSGASRGVAAVIASVLGIPVDAIEAAAIETTTWIGLFGPLAFPVAVLVTMVTIELIRRGVSRVV